MQPVTFDRFSGVRIPDPQDVPDTYCDTCGEQMDGSQFCDDICDECAVRVGFLEREESQ